MSAAVPSLTSRFDLRDRHVVVTGAASGLGLAIWQGLLELGAHVTAIDLDGNALTTASTAFGAPDDRFSLRVCDVADHEAIASAIAGRADPHQHRRVRGRSPRTSSASGAPPCCWGG